MLRLYRECNNDGAIIFVCKFTRTTLSVLLYRPMCFICLWVITHETRIATRIEPIASIWIQASAILTMHI